MRDLLSDFRALPRLLLESLVFCIVVGTLIMAAFKAAGYPV